MREDEIGDMAGMMAIAEKLGKDRTDLEKRNKMRMAKGRKPLPNDQERKDSEVLKINYRTGDYTTVDGSQALRLFELRKASMDYPDDVQDEGDDAIAELANRKPPSAAHTTPENAQAKAQSSEKDVERAVREAEAARRIQDMKAGRIDHSSNWSPDGQKLEGGDETALPSGMNVWASSGREDEVREVPTGSDMDEQPVGSEASGEYEKPSRKKKTFKKSNAAKGLMPAAAGLNEFKEDLYERLRVSFEALETTLSDMQGRISEIVTASAANAQPGDPVNEDEAFKALLERKIPVTFDVGGTKMKFDAVTVFHASPCITVVSKSGSATIMPKPGARLKLSYEMDGTSYDDDPVTFLGTRFDLPMFGLSFVGFIRDSEADMIDAGSEA